ncbi:hypothetical protein NIES4101_53450 [Calothrix sp. NIES-4101]|nr:hypothetical protein NIES4101_53450 [Calothrix sp. NIES-4101]
MDTLDLQPVATEEVMLRYGIKSRTTLNKFLENAGISSFRDGRKTFIKAFELGTLDEYAKQLNYPVTHEKSDIQSNDLVCSAQLEEVRATTTTECFPISTIDLLYVTNEYENLPRLAKWLAAYTFLEKMASGKVIMPKDIVLRILEYKRLPPCKQGYFAWGGFTFFMVEENRKHWIVVKEKTRLNREAHIFSLPLNSPRQTQ